MPHTYLGQPPDLLILDGCKVLEGETMRRQCISKRLHPDASLHRDLQAFTCIVGRVCFAAGGGVVGWFSTTTAVTGIYMLFTWSSNAMPSSP
jgi:hypothetical protein